MTSWLTSWEHGLREVMERYGPVSTGFSLVSVRYKAWLLEAYGHEFSGFVGTEVRFRHLESHYAVPEAREPLKDVIGVLKAAEDVVRAARRFGPVGFMPATERLGELYRKWLAKEGLEWIQNGSWILVEPAQEAPEQAWLAWSQPEEIAVYLLGEETDEEEDCDEIDDGSEGYIAGLIRAVADEAGAVDRTEVGNGYLRISHGEWEIIMEGWAIGWPERATAEWWLRIQHGCWRNAYPPPEARVSLGELARSLRLAQRVADAARRRGVLLVAAGTDAARRIVGAWLSREGIGHVPMSGWVAVEPHPDAHQAAWEAWRANYAAGS